MPNIGEKEKELVMDCLDSTWISSKGKYVDLFEEKLAQLAGVKHVIAMHNGTHSLHIACLLAKLDADSEVIVPSFSYVATANVVAYCCAKPIFVDVSSEDWNLDVDDVERKITSKTKAIIGVDIYGKPADYDRLHELVSGKDITIIADSAESIGSWYHGKPSGSLGHISSFSFFGNKTVTTGEGGAMLTDNDDYAALARQLKNQGNSNSKRYFHDVLGYNYRMTNIQAAIGLAQLSRLDETVQRKRQIYNRYKSNLKDLVTFQCTDKDVTSSHWLVSFCLPAHADRASLESYLLDNGIESRPFFTPIDQLPYFVSGDFSVSNDISKRGISLPSYPQLKDEQVDYICQHVIDYLNKQ